MILNYKNFKLNTKGVGFGIYYTSFISNFNLANTHQTRKRKTHFWCIFVRCFVKLLHVFGGKF